MPRISQLDSETTPANDDELAIVDTSGAVTKKITRGNLLGGAPLPANSVDTQAIAPGAVSSPKLAEGFFKGQRRNHTTTVAKTGQKVVFGYQYVEGTGSASLSGSANFDYPFASPPIVLATPTYADVSGAPAAIGEFDTSSANLIGVTVGLIDEDGFAFRFIRSSGTFAAGNYYAVTYIAIGDEAV